MARRSERQQSVDEPPGYLVWVRGLSGPEPQKWTALEFGIDNSRQSQVLAYRELSREERALSLATLAERYPAPRIDNT